MAAGIGLAFRVEVNFEVVVACALAAGCGSNSGTSTPAGAARKIVDLVRSGQLAQAREHFVTVDLVPTLRDSLRNQSDVSVGEVHMKDSASATVDIYSGTKQDAPGMTFMMVKTGAEWKIIQIIVY